MLLFQVIAKSGTEIGAPQQQYQVQSLKKEKKKKENLDDERKPEGKKKKKHTNVFLPNNLDMDTD